MGSRLSAPPPDSKTLHPPKFFATARDLRFMIVLNTPLYKRTTIDTDKKTMQK